MPGHKHALERLDARLSEAADARDNPLVRVAGGASELADQPPLVLLCAGVTAAGLLTRDRRLARAGIRMLLAHAIATGIKTAFKRSVDRTRPEAAPPTHDKGRLRKGGSDTHEENAFPSGHTAGAVAVARALSHDYPGLAPLAHGAAAAAAAIQVPRGTHYPGDVLAGTLIGLAAEPLASWLVARGDRLVPRQKLATGEDLI